MYFPDYGFEFERKEVPVEDFTELSTGGMSQLQVEGSDQTIN